MLGQTQEPRTHSIWVSHLDGKNPSSWTIAVTFQSVLAGSWSWELYNVVDNTWCVFITLPSLSKPHLSEYTTIWFFSHRKVGWDLGVGYCDVLGFICLWKLLLSTSVITFIYSMTFIYSPHISFFVSIHLRCVEERDKSPTHWFILQTPKMGWSGPKLEPKIQSPELEAVLKSQSRYQTQVLHFGAWHRHWSHNYWANCPFKYIMSASHVPGIM